MARRRRAGRGRGRPQPALAAAGAARRAGRHGPRERSTRFLAEEPTATSRVDHARAVASLPDDAAKAWAWGRFTGAEDVPNYELQATGQGMWLPGPGAPHDAVRRAVLRRPAHHDLAPLGLGAGRRGVLVLPDHLAGRRAPCTWPSRLAGDESLDLSLRRQLRVMADELQRRLTARAVPA